MLDFIQDYENHLINVKRASSNTVSSYMRDIRQFSAWIQQNEDATVLNATQTDITRYLNDLQLHGKSSSTVYRSALVINPAAFSTDSCKDRPLTRPPATMAAKASPVPDLSPPIFGSRTMEWLPPFS